MQTQKRHLESELFEWSHPLCVLYKLLYYDIETIENKRKELKDKIKNL